MADRPIIFSAPMVRALMDGRKTQTRRMIKAAPPEATSAGTTYSSLTGHSNVWTWLSGDPRDCETWEVLDDFRLPYAPGDRLYVKEAFRGDVGYDKTPPREWSQWPVSYEADPFEARCGLDVGRLLPGIHMPRWASRLTLTVTDVRVQRLQDISEADAIAEGIERLKSGRGFYDPTVSHAAVRFGEWTSTARQGFCRLWNSLHGPGAWDANPWVVALTFTVQSGNIDKIGDANG